MILKDQITNIFAYIDDFCKEFDAQIKKMKREALSDSKKRRTELQEFLILKSSIMIGFNLGLTKHLNIITWK